MDDKFVVANDKSNCEHKCSTNIHRPDSDFLACRRNVHKHSYRQGGNQ